MLEKNSSSLPFGAYLVQPKQNQPKESSKNLHSIRLSITKIKQEKQLHQTNTHLAPPNENYLKAIK